MNKIPTAAEAIAYGAVTIVNAIPAGKGAALGIDLWTKAKVELTDKPGIYDVKIKSEPWEDTRLSEKAVEKTLQYLRLHRKYGAEVTTESTIPIARGLKSSSAAANAIVTATAAAAGRNIPKMKIVELGVEAAIEAGVTITGALDDASASFYGNIVLTDNLKRRIVKRMKVKERVAVLLHIPPYKIYTKNIDLQKMKAIAHISEKAFEEAEKGNVWTAMTINGLGCAAALGEDASIIVEALKAGALAAGISGTGPALSVVVKKERAKEVYGILERVEGKVIHTSVNHREAGVVKYW
ncbi:MAG: shikimate kinase [Candidatus Bathyarchaeia archaeon]